MSSVVSGNYRELRPDEVESVANECARAWTDYLIPIRQYEIVQPELDRLREGQPCAPFDALARLLAQIPEFDHRPRVLDVGASSGYYREVLELSGFPCHYTGIDFSPAFQRFARTLYPDIDYDLGDARELPYPDDMFDAVLHGAVLMHCRDYEKAIQEAARVSRRYVIFHRTPVVLDHPTRFFEKDAYGVRCLEIHFNEAELLRLFEAAGLYLHHSVVIFTDRGFGHRSYLLETLNHVQV